MTYDERKYLDYVAILVTLLLLLLLVSLAHCQQLPDAPQKVVDKNFVVASLVYAGAVAFDGYTTAAAVFHGGCYEGGSPWLLGKYPSPAKDAAIGAAEFAVGEGVTYLLKRESRRKHLNWLSYVWFAPIAEQTSEHLYGGIHNVRETQCR